MCLTEYNEKVYTDSIRAEGHAEGLAEGLAEGAAQFGKLVQVLLAENRVDLVQLVSTDEKAREEYYIAYNIK